MDGEKPNDPDIARIWLLTTIAKEFGVLPSVVARDLDEDPEQLSMVCLPLLRYAEAKAALDSNNQTLIKQWEGNPLFDIVKQNVFARAEADLAQRSES